MTLDWNETKAKIGKRIEELRVQLEVVGLAPDETNALRGRIAELRQFVADHEPDAHIPIPAAIPYT